MRRRLAALWLLGAGTAQAADMLALRYIDQDPGEASYLTRVLVTPDYLRMDGGEDGGDFVLLDRRRRNVLNVMRDSGQVMVFTPGAVPPRPAGWKPRLDTRKLAPDTLRFSLSVNGVTCSEGVAARRAPDAARAMAELKAVLAAMQYRVWTDTPREMQHECDLANQVWEPDAALKLGLPLEEREFTGRTRRLESESVLPLQPGLFRVPAGMAAINAPS